jgi:Holliday junction resolvase-like predicted endonuclease
MKNKDLGALGEEIALRYLISRGHMLVARNVRVGGSEIDIVTRERGLCHFVEVKTVARERAGEDDCKIPAIHNPLQRVTREKISAQKRAIELFVAQRGLGDWEFCVLGVIVDLASGEAACEFFVEYSV